ncbi:MAG: tetratricopeptide repeat protein [Treponema sp.]|jgi:tetratricopeptide (TPR) repeat protein|nr:tetratricopeptide repeat protein [Treponema sp.]
MKTDFAALSRFCFLLLAFFSILLSFSCGGGKEVSYTLALREGLVPSAEAAAAAVDDFIQAAGGEPRTNAGGSVSVIGADGGEIVRFYGVVTGEGTETIGITPEGYYRASRRGAACLMVHTKNGVYSLSRFAETFFRPDLPANPPEDGAAGRETLAGLLAEKAPPEIQGPLGITVRDGDIDLDFEATDESGGGIGTLALFYRDRRGEEFPAAIRDAKGLVREKRRKGGKTIYHIFLSIPRPPKFGAAGLGVSIFNGDNSAASERLWAELPGLRDIPSASGKPVLHVLTLNSGPPETTRALEAAFARQGTGALYQAVKVRGLHGRDLGREGFFRSFGALSAEAGGEDVIVCILSLSGSIDGRGDFRFLLAGPSGEEALDKWDLAAAFSSLDTHKVMVLLDIHGPQATEAKTAFLRLQDWLGPGVFLGFANSSQGEEAHDAFMPVLLEAAGAAWAGNRRYPGAAEFAGFVQRALPASTAFFPAEDFPLIDRYYAAGELRMQTMFSGAVLIEGFDAESRPLTFGETQTRLLPPGTYSVTMTYRNGRRETKRAEIREGRGEWAVFTYTPELLAEDLKGRLPAFGVNLEELNPGNYKKTGAAILEKMDVPPYYAAFLSGEQLYRAGDYDKAIAEYSRSVKLKGDYTEAFVSRGNAWRRKGDVNSAIADYSRALSLKTDYAEVYNYRGFLYARQGNHERAVEDYTRALRLKSGYADAWFNRAYGYAELKDWDRAIADYTQVIKLEPSNAAAYRERAYAWSQKGDTAKAGADYAAAELLDR